EPLADHRARSCVAARAPGEVLAHGGAARAEGPHPLREVAVSEVALREHLGRVGAGRALKRGVEADGGEAVRGAGLVDGAEQARLGRVQARGGSRRCCSEEQKTCRKSYKNMSFDQHSGTIASSKRLALTQMGDPPAAYTPEDGT